MYEGVGISALRLPGGGGAIAPAYAVTNGVAIIASSPEEIRDAIDARSRHRAVTSSPNFTNAMAATGTRGTGLVYVDVRGVAAAIRRSLPPDLAAEFDRDVAPNLAPVRAFAVTSTGSTREMSVRMFLAIG